MARPRKRLCDRAFLLLEEELKRVCGTSPTAQVNRGIVLQRLERLRQREGEPAGYAELKMAVDVIPDFSDQVLKKAAQANQPNRVGKTLEWMMGSAAAVGALAGGLWLLNLPYPMIRWPVANTAPILLLPSFMQMDHDYRQAIIHVEQADQLINAATSAADFELGAEKAAQAQRHLDRLPVWFLGYYPQRYCSWMSCGWRFTLDEFESARALVGRMEAQIFQEQNALSQLEEATLAVDSARQRYEAAQAEADKNSSLENWQLGMDRLAEIPPETLAGQTAQTRLQAFQRDYSQLAGTTASVGQTNRFLTAARNFAAVASRESQNPPHSAATWGRIAGQWENALGQLGQVTPESEAYTEAQQLKADYQNQLEIIRERQLQEQAAVQTYNQAQERLTRLMSVPADIDQLSELRNIQTQLSQIPVGTTVSDSAEVLMDVAQQQDWRVRQAAE